VFFEGAAYQKSQSAVFMLPKKVSFQQASEQSVGDVWIVQLDRKSSTSEVQWLQKFCRCNCWVFIVSHNSECQLTAESAECCKTWGTSHLPSREAPARTATGEPDIPLWTWHVFRWVDNGVRVVLAWCDVPRWYKRGWSSRTVTYPSTNWARCTFN